MLQPELNFRRDKIRNLMVSQGIDAALITCELIHHLFKQFGLNLNDFHNNDVFLFHCNWSAR